MAGLKFFADSPFAIAMKSESPGRASAWFAVAITLPFTNIEFSKIGLRDRFGDCTQVP